MLQVHLSGNIVGSMRAPGLAVGARHVVCNPRANVMIPDNKRSASTSYVQVRTVSLSSEEEERGLAAVDDRAGARQIRSKTRSWLYCNVS